MKHLVTCFFIFWYTIGTFEYVLFIYFFLWQQWSPKINLSIQVINSPINKIEFIHLLNKWYMKYYHWMQVLP